MSDSVTEMLDWFRHISETTDVTHVWKDGVYQGCSVTYAHPLHPALATVFHPYIPLVVMFAEPEQATREYFERHGFRVPPGG